MEEVVAGFREGAKPLAHWKKIADQKVRSSGGEPTSGRGG